MDVIFCNSCNPDHLIEWDRRRVSVEASPRQELRLMSRRGRSLGIDRRAQVPEDLGFPERRDVLKRRMADGSACFQGSGEEAARNGWMLAEETILCPLCRRQNNAP